MTVNITGIPEMLHSSLHEFCRRLKIIVDTVLFFEYLFFPLTLILGAIVFCALSGLTMMSARVGSPAPCCRPSLRDTHLNSCSWTCRRKCSSTVPLPCCLFLLGSPCEFVPASISLMNRFCMPGRPCVSPSLHVQRCREDIFPCPYAHRMLCISYPSTSCNIIACQTRFPINALLLSEAPNIPEQRFEC